MKLPVEFENKMKEYLGEEYEAFIASYDEPEVKGLRLNKLFDLDKVPALAKMTELGDTNYNSVPWMNGAFYYELGNETCEDGTIGEKSVVSVKSTSADALSKRPGKHPYHEGGAYYIQEPSAMAPVVYLDVKPGDRVLDLCAAPGGKSTQIAGFLQGEGILITNEIMPDRARILSENVERMGVRNALVISEDPRNISDKFAGFFDKILVDAPCSGEGMFRRSETAINEWSLENVKLCAERQEWILDEAYKMLAPGGRLVYSTCTFAKEEDEEQVKSFVLRHTDMSIADMPLYEGMRQGFDGIGVRLFPHMIKGEGHYVCAFKKSGDNSMKVPPVCGYEEDITKKDREELKDMFDFVEDFFKGTSFAEYFSERRITRFKDQIYLLPKDCPSLKGLKVLRPGLHLGTILKNRFEPGHALAMAVDISEVKNACNIILEGQEVYKYFRGETFNIMPEMIKTSKPQENQLVTQDVVKTKKRKNDQNSQSKKDKTGSDNWYVIFVDGLSIGWGKLTNEIMKNHYPKGLRKSLT